MTTSTPRILNPDNWLWIIKYEPEALYDMIHNLSTSELRELHQQRNVIGEHFVYSLVQSRSDDFDDSLALLKKAGAARLEYLCHAH